MSACSGGQNAKYPCYPLCCCNLLCPPMVKHEMLQEEGILERQRGFSSPLHSLGWPVQRDLLEVGAGFGAAAGNAIKGMGVMESSGAAGAFQDDTEKCGQGLFPCSKQVICYAWWDLLFEVRDQMRRDSESDSSGCLQRSEGGSTACCPKAASKTCELWFLAPCVAMGVFHPCCGGASPRQDLATQGNALISVIKFCFCCFWQAALSPLTVTMTAPVKLFGAGQMF